MSEATQLKRVLFMAFLLLVAFLTLGYRMVDLQVLRAERLAGIAANNTHRTFYKEPRRGDIRDRRGNLLAGSLIVKTICADPRLTAPHHKRLAHALGPLLQMEPTELEKRLQQTFTNAKGEERLRHNVILKKKVPADHWDAIQKTLKNLDLGIDEKALNPAERRDLWAVREKGIIADKVDDQLRYYPQKTRAAHVVGYVGDRKDGIERRMDLMLTGIGGWRSTETVRNSELLTFRNQDIEARPGQSVFLTIDSGIQHIVETELADAIEKFAAESGCAIAVRPSTGEILALANFPTFDPNRYNNYPADFLRNRAIMDSFEPGSTFKIVAVAAAIEEGMVDLNSMIDCEKGYWWYAGKRLKDDHAASIISIEQIIAKSSNIGTAKLGVQLGPDRLYKYVRDFGFGSRTGIQLDGEVVGIVHAPGSRSWNKLTVTRVPIGHGIATTPLQNVMAMSAVANGGRLMQPLLVSRVEDENGNLILQNHPHQVRQVIGEETARKMVTALKTVVSTNGTARRAILEHYTAGGKTGTAEKPSPHGGYMKGKYFASFIGFFPADNPELCIGVFLDDPKPVYYGGSTATVAFRGMAERSAKYLAIRPDKISKDTLIAAGSAPQPGSNTN